MAEAQVGAGQVGAGQVGAGQVGAAQVGEGQVGAAQAGAAQVGEAQVGEGTLQWHATAHRTALRSHICSGTCLSAAAAGESAVIDDSSLCSTACIPAQT